MRACRSGIDVCHSIITYTNNTKDFMVPSVWGTVDKKEDPYAPQQSGGCCVVM
jgi:guanine nucleotide-binding protein subunit gamma